MRRARHRPAAAERERGAGAPGPAHDLRDAAPAARRSRRHRAQGDGRRSPIAPLRIGRRARRRPRSLSARAAGRRARAVGGLHAEDALRARHRVATVAIARGRRSWRSSSRSASRCGSVRSRYARSPRRARFNEVRQLANTLIFKIHDAVAPLAGSTPVRQTIVNEAIAYLERLEAESRPATNRASSGLELSAGYRQIAVDPGRSGASESRRSGRRASPVRTRPRADVLPMATRPASIVRLQPRSRSSIS